MAYHLNRAASVLNRSRFYSHLILRLALPSIEPNVPLLSILHISCICLSAYILTTQHIKRKPVHLSVSPISAVTISETILTQCHTAPREPRATWALDCTIHNPINSWTDIHMDGVAMKTCPHRAKWRAKKEIPNSKDDKHSGYNKCDWTRSWWPGDQEMEVERLCEPLQWTEPLDLKYAFRKTP